MTDGILEIFRYGFMQRALLAGLFVGGICGLLGVFVVLRRTSQLGDSLAHAAFGGVALGVMLGIYPVYAALFVAVVGGIAIHALRERGVYGDLAVTIVYATGLAGGVFLISFSGGLNVDLLSLLFGSILTVSWTDVAMIAGLFVLTLSVLAFLYKEIFAFAFDPEGARVSGVPVHALDVGFTVLTAVAVVLSMRAVGILLVAPLLVLPAASSMRLRLGMRATIAAAVGFALLAIVAGLLLSYFLDTATGATIVLVALLCFAGLLSAEAVGRRFPGVERT
ncbi:MAG TPA: metal ABC transporter permease [Thermoplasmata archaeon]|jgi:zinc transport system permease protein|nr:metal ABC transporter permease [Thermoplasmata archaeon]